MTADEDWTKRYRPSVEAEVHAKEEERERLAREAESSRRAHMELRASNEAVLAEYRQVLATRITQIYQKLVAAGCPGAVEIGPRKKFKRSVRGWHIYYRDRLLETIHTDGTSPGYDAGIHKYRQRSISEIAADALQPYRHVKGRPGYDEWGHSVDRLDESTAGLRAWAEAVIDIWSRALTELLPKELD